MSVDPGSTGVTWGSDSSLEQLRDAYLATYRGPHGDAPGTGADAADTGALPRVSADDDRVPTELLAAHVALAQRRAPGEVAVAVHDGGESFAPALQVVTDHAGMQMDSVTVLLHRLGAAYHAIMNPVFLVRRNGSGEIESVSPRVTGQDDAGVPAETWIHIELAPSVNRAALAQAADSLPKVLADARQVGLDAAPMGSALLNLAAQLDADDSDRFHGPDRHEVADLLRWLADGHFVLLGCQRCPVRDGRASVEASSRLGVLRFREDVLPQLTRSDDLLVLAQATIPSFLRYGAYPYIVVVREQTDADQVIEHRFVGLFTVAAMSANVLEIPLVSKRVHAALALAQNDPNHPGQLLLDVIQTVPRSELFALSAEELRDMAMTVIDLGSRRRTLLFAAATSWATSCPAWCTCRGIATPPPCGSRCRTSWFANLVARASTIPPGSVNHPGRWSISPSRCPAAPIRGVSISPSPTRPASSTC